MSGINITSIIKKVEAYGKTEEGKRRMKECIEKYAKDGVERAAAGDRIITEANMYTAASKMVRVLQDTARSYALPASIIKHFDDLECSEIYKMPDGSSTIYIYFGGDLHRNSLYPDGYDGVSNIVALLNNGYRAKNYVYGDWDGHSPTGESRFDGRSIDTSAYIRSRKDREGLHFIQQAVNDFNGNYGSDYDVTAVAAEDYEKDE